MPDKNNSESKPVQPVKEITPKEDIQPPKFDLLKKGPTGKPNEKITPPKFNTKK